MARDRSLVRASDIGAWAFCQRAWWLANVQGAEHENPADLSRGTAVHEAHGDDVRQAHQLRRVGLILVGSGVLFLLLAILFRLLSG
jgi:hypothetical protein